jgi:hypothetical protein
MCYPFLGYGGNLLRSGRSTMKQMNFVHAYTKEKESTKTLIITAVLVSVGVNVLSSGIIKYFRLENNTAHLTLVGLFLSLGAILYLFFSSIKRINKELHLTGFFIYNNSTHSFVPIDGYDITKDFNQYLKALFAENKALKSFGNIVL